MAPPHSQEIMEETQYESTEIEGITDGSMDVNESIGVASVPGDKRTRKRKRSILADSDLGDSALAKVVSKTRKSKKRSKQLRHEECTEMEEINSMERTCLASLPTTRCNGGNRKRSTLDDEDDSDFPLIKAKSKKHKRAKTLCPDSENSDPTRKKKRKVKKAKFSVDTLHEERKNMKLKAAKFQIVAAPCHVSISLYDFFPCCIVGLVYRVH